LTQELKLEISDAAKDKIAEEGFDKVYGARPLRRVIQRVIEDPLSEELLRFKYKAGDSVLVEVGDSGEIQLGKATPKASRTKEPKEPKEAKQPDDPAAPPTAPAASAAPSNTKADPET
jgi:ATP-dependent Clp protease ATP-binding subunit ClpC